MPSAPNRFPLPSLSTEDTFYGKTWIFFLAIVLWSMTTFLLFINALLISGTPDINLFHTWFVFILSLTISILYTTWSLQRRRAVSLQLTETQWYSTFNTIRWLEFAFYVVIALLHVWIVITMVQYSQAFIEITGWITAAIILIATAFILTALDRALGEKLTPQPLFSRSLPYQKPVSGKMVWTLPARQK